MLGFRMVSETQVSSSAVQGRNKQPTDHKNLKSDRNSSIINNEENEGSIAFAEIKASKNPH